MLQNVNMASFVLFNINLECIIIQYVQVVLNFFLKNIVKRFDLTLYLCDVPVHQIHGLRELPGPRMEHLVAVEASAKGGAGNQ